MCPSGGEDGAKQLLMLVQVPLLSSKIAWLRCGNALDAAEIDGTYAMMDLYMQSASH